MNEELNLDDLDFILESLKYTKLKFEEYTNYPSQEFKLQRINRVTEVIQKVNNLKKNF